MAGQSYPMLSFGMLKIPVRLAGTIIRLERQLVYESIFIPAAFYKIVPETSPPPDRMVMLPGLDPDPCPGMQPAITSIDQFEISY
jgi:hypothetical protein